MTAIPVGFTGTRSTDEVSDARIALLRAELVYMRDMGYNEFHHGDCVGMDALAHGIALDLGYSVVIHPPISRKQRAFCEPATILEPKDYLARNRDIVDSTGVLIAVPKHPDKPVLRSGTWATVRYAERRGIPVSLF